MAFLQYEGVGITAMSAAVPRRVVKGREYTEVFSQEEANEIVDKTGIEERRFADSETCSSDLCYAAAEKLIADNNINKEEIDLLVFIRRPLTTGCLLHLVHFSIVWDYLTLPSLLTLPWDALHSSMVCLWFMV